LGIKLALSLVHIPHLQLRYFVGKQMLNLCYFMPLLDNNPRGPKHVGFLLQIFGAERGGGGFEKNNA
jgi:hypothetical protein